MREIWLTITAIENETLLAPFIEKEIQDAVFAMHPDKSPEPNGMNPAYYQRYWNIVGKDISAACLSFIASCEFPEGINDTHIVLIPKKKQVESMCGLRPISLCNACPL